MEEENITLDALPGESQLNSADADRTVGNVTSEQMDSLSLSELNSHLGKNFKDKPTALKALKDTFSYVGKKKEDIAKEIAPKDDFTQKFVGELEELRKERFYDKNPQYAQPTIRKIIERVGGNPADVVESQEFKEVFSKVQGYDENQKLRTVLESNPRLASTRDAFSKARDLQQKGASKEAIEQTVTRGVLDALGM